MAQIRVLAVDALGFLATACGKFSFGASGCMDGMDAACTKVLEAMRERQAAARREVESASNELDRLHDEGPPDDDDDDSSASNDYYDAIYAAESQLADAEQSADRINGAVFKVECAYNEFLRHADTLRSLLENEFQLGINDLRSKVGVLNEWNGVAASAHPPSQSSSGVPSAGAPAVASRKAPPAYQELSSVPLPKGFRWVRLDDINLDEALRDVRGPENFSKVPYAEISRGYDVLLSDILPRMQNLPVDSDTFRKLDQERGVDHEHGSQRAFDAFFSLSDSISLSRGARPSRGLSVDSGRHRIRVALDMGWPAVIVRTNESTKDLL